MHGRKRPDILSIDPLRILIAKLSSPECLLRGLEVLRISPKTMSLAPLRCGIDRRTINQGRTCAIKLSSILIKEPHRQPTYRENSRHA